MRFTLVAALWAGCQVHAPSDDSRLPALVEALGADEVSRRVEAERALAAWGERAETALLEGLERGDLELRTRAERLLERIRWNRAAPILFARPSVDPTELWIYDSRTGRERRIVEGSATLTGIWCSPDGKGFILRRAEDRLVYRDFATGEEEELTHLAPFGKALAWSPDASLVLLASYALFNEDGLSADDGYPRLYVLDFGTGAYRLLTSDRRSHYFACWSPDGKQVAYICSDLESRDAFNTFDLFVVDAAGGEPRRLTRDLAPKYSLTWSPDGRRLAFAWEDPVQVSPENPANGSRSSPRIGILDLGTGRAWKIPAGVLGACRPAWSPDGKWIAFFCTRTEAGSELCVSDADGKELRGLRSVANDLQQIGWSPDSQRLLFAEYDGELTRMAVVNRDGTGYRPIIQDSGTAVWLPRR